MSEFESGVHHQEPSHINRLLGRVGLVYGDGLSEFGLKHVGWGIPLHRRSTLDAAEQGVRAGLAALDETYEISDNS